jgi:hydrogenase maturation protease
VRGAQAAESGGDVSANGKPAIAILGMGNLIYSDDGAGLRAFYRLEKDPRLPAGVDLVDGSAAGLPAVSLLECADRLLILDAVNVGAEPGTVVRLGPEQLKGLPGGAEAHQLGVSDLITALRLMGKTPREIILLGIQADSIALGTDLTPAVESGLERLVTESLRLLAEWAA